MTCNTYCGIGKNGQIFEGEQGMRKRESKEQTKKKENRREKSKQNFIYKKGKRN